MDEASSAILTYLEDRGASQPLFYIIDTLIDRKFARSTLLGAVEVMLADGRLILTSDKFISIP